MIFEVREWMEDAECTTAQNPEIFFPDGEVGYLQAGAARVYCNRCMVAAECLEYAMSNNIEHGIFAGTTPKQRQAIRRRSA